MSEFVAILAMIFLPFHFPLAVLELHVRHPDFILAWRWPQRRQSLIGYPERVERAQVQVTGGRKSRIELERAQSLRCPPTMPAIGAALIISATDQLLLNFREHHAPIHSGLRRLMTGVQ